MSDGFAIQLEGLGAAEDLLELAEDLRGSRRELLASPAQTVDRGRVDAGQDGHAAVKVVEVLEVLGELDALGHDLGALAQLGGLEDRARDPVREIVEASDELEHVGRLVLGLGLAPGLIEQLGRLPATSIMHE